MKRVSLSRSTAKKAFDESLGHFLVFLGENLSIRKTHILKEAVRPGPIGWVGWAVLTLMGVLLAAALIIGILQNQAGIACPR